MKLLSVGMACVALAAQVAFGADSESHQKTKVCNPGETSCAEVKAASTAPGASDTALVVVPSPNGNHATAANQSTQITSLQLLDDVPTAMNGAFVKGNPVMGQLDDASTTAATEDNLAPWRLTAQRAGHVNLRDTAGAAVGTSDNPIYTTGNAEILSPLPGFVARSAKVLAAGVTQYQTYTMVDDIALIDFHFGGRGPGQAAIFRLDPAASQLVPSGGFNSSGDVSTWTNTSNGSSAGISWVYNTAQFTEGTGSASHTFTQSDQNNYPEITYTWGSAQDLNAWRYIVASVRVTVATGGNQTRTVSIILEDVNAATRTYSTSGTTTTAPFSTEQWLTITGDIESPTSSTGTFDPYNVSKIHLRLQDGGNKTGTVYWDNVHFEDSQELIERIYIDANRTFQLVLDPAELFDVGETLAMRFKNNDTVSREFTVTAKGVER